MARTHRRTQAQGARAFALQRQGQRGQITQRSGAMHAQTTLRQDAIGHGGKQLHKAIGQQR